MSKNLGKPPKWAQEGRTPFHKHRLGSHRKINWGKIWREANPTWDQAKKIIERCGGIEATAVLAELNPFQVAKWLKPAPEGMKMDYKREQYTDGLVPMKYLLRILRNARYFGVLMRVEDLYPDLIKNNADVMGLAFIDNEEWKEMKAWMDKNRTRLDKLTEKSQNITWE